VTVEGLITVTEGEHLAELAAKVSDGQVIVEVGSYKGMSATYLASGGTVHCVDLWDLGGQRHANRYANREVFKEFQRTTRHLAVVAHKGSSVDVAARWEGPQIGLLFIDGEHTYQAVRSDIAAWTPHLADGAVVAFHDYYAKFPGVIQAVDEWAAGRPVEHIERLAVVR
jgi:predicted O-methyltransferase YrrM